MPWLPLAAALARRSAWQPSAPLDARLGALHIGGTASSAPQTPSAPPDEISRLRASNSWEGLSEPQRRFLKAAGWLALGALVILPAVPGYRPRYSMPVYAPLLMALALAGETLRPGQTGWSLWRTLIAVAGEVAVVGGLAAVAWALRETYPKHSSFLPH